MTIHIRLMQRTDLAFADDLRGLAGWNQTPQDWERFLALEPAGCFIAEWDGRPAGTATLTCYGVELAWVGMLLVHPALRRHGLGCALLQHCVNTAEQRGVPCVKLDATPLGQRLYESFGFTAEDAITRCQTSYLTRTALDSNLSVARAEKGDLAELIEMDQVAFGLNRAQLLERVFEQSEVLVLRGSGQSQGFGMIRPGSRAHYLGPVIARSTEAGEALVAHLLQRVAGQLVYWDVLDANRPARDLAARLGFRVQRPLTRMARGQSALRPHLSLQYAIIDPAVG